MTSVPQQHALAAAAAGAARQVPGVAYLSPGLSHRLRAAVPRHPSRQPTPDATAGVRVRCGTGPAEHAVEVSVSLAVHSGHQAAHVARAVRAAVTAAVRDTGTAAGPVTVTVTVTAIT
ncbi:Asp23/Gls24 family envelope stress response protein [Streptomyces sp. NPDC006733]|uniref:Asp23/Gls24 family envelope stress response protein n=1 Tax=Streptomyces sp. NPDC006733 TaxID=3155460 RepID=UPI0033F15081